MKFLCAAKNSTFKNHPRDILRDENHLYGIVLVHIVHKTALKYNKMLTGGRILIFKKNAKARIFSSLPHCLTASLTDHSRKPRAQTKQRTATILCHNNKLTSGMCLLGFQRVCALCALSFIYFQSGCLSSSSNETISRH